MIDNHSIDFKTLTDIKPHKHDVTTMDYENLASDFITDSNGSALFMCFLLVQLEAIHNFVHSN